MYEKWGGKNIFILIQVENIHLSNGKLLNKILR